MRLTLLRYLLTCVCFSVFILANGQTNHTLSGYIKDKESGETLIGANIHLEADLINGTVTNTYGFYSITLPEGVHRFVFSYLGYQSLTKEISLDTNTTLNVDLISGIEMREVVVSATEDQEDENVQSTSMGRVNLPTEQIKVLPALLGEIDILKTIQLLPGVSSAGEGSAGFYVRG
ncbi:MAG: carboxypeptidase-like regulatory domain-containing protein, partial [Saprospiraceae bacterium]